MRDPSILRHCWRVLLLEKSVVGSDGILLLKWGRLLRLLSVTLITLVLLLTFILLCTFCVTHCIDGGGQRVIDVTALTIIDAVHI